MILVFIVTVLLAWLIFVVFTYKRYPEFYFVNLIYRFFSKITSRMGEKHEDSPSKEEQRLILCSKLAKSAVAGENWYLVNAKWMKQLKEYVGIIHCDHPVYPGPIDNIAILAPDLANLKKGLAENIDYVLVSEESWNLLCDWYGIYKDQMPIKRKAILAGVNYTMIEVYLVELKCYDSFELRNCLKIRVSKSDTLASVNIHLKEKFSVDQESRLWVYFGKDNFSLLDLSTTVKDAGLSDNQTIVLDVKLPSGHWQERVVSEVLNRPSTSKKVIKEAPCRRITRSASRLSSKNRSPQKPGLSGLVNNGNICYLNSVIQCLSNVPPITNYFLSDKYLDELNVFNPMGMHGDAARSYAELIQMLWSGNHSSTSPQDFKSKIGKYNVNFAGGNQQDAQEFLSFLLDGLHEDLNRITNKPYVPNQDYMGENDHEFAEKLWQNYKLRNDSVIVDLCHGFLKSMVICSKCEQFSIAFDPFCILSLPIPQTDEHAFNVKYYPDDPGKKEVLHKVKLPRKSLIKDLCHEVSLKTGAEPFQMIVAVSSNSHLHRFYSREESLESHDDKEFFHVFQLKKISRSFNEEDDIIIPVHFWEKCRPTDKFAFSHLFGVPLLAVLPRNIDEEGLKYTILHLMSRHFFVATDPGTSSNKSHTTQYEPRLFVLKLGYPGLAVPKKLEFNHEGICVNLADSTDHEPERIFCRKILLVQMNVEEKQLFYNERAPAHGPDYPSSKKHQEKELTFDIHDCLDLFTTFESLGAENTWFCPDCKVNQRATKKIDLWKVPKILIIHLKRFFYNRNGNKVNSFVNFPVRKLRFSKYTINPHQRDVSYNLIGVINHYGVLTSGHYTAFCKNKTSKLWYCFDDEFIYEVKEEDIVTASAYVLFYMRNDPVHDQAEMV